MKTVCYHNNTYYYYNVIHTHIISYVVNPSTNVTRLCVCVYDAFTVKKITITTVVIVIIKIIIKHKSWRFEDGELFEDENGGDDRKEVLQAVVFGWCARFRRRQRGFAAFSTKSAESRSRTVDNGRDRLVRSIGSPGRVLRRRRVQVQPPMPPPPARRENAIRHRRSSSVHPINHTHSPPHDSPPLPGSSCPRRSRVRRHTAAGSTDAATAAPPHGNDRAARNYAPGKDGIRSYIIIITYRYHNRIIYNIALAVTNREMQTNCHVFNRVITIYNYYNLMYGQVVGSSQFRLSSTFDFITTLKIIIYHL